MLQNQSARVDKSLAAGEPGRGAGQSTASGQGQAPASSLAPPPGGFLVVEELLLKLGTGSTGEILHMSDIYLRGPWPQANREYAQICPAWLKLKFSGSANLGLDWEPQSSRLLGNPPLRPLGTQNRDKPRLKKKMLACTRAHMLCFQGPTNT